MSERRDKFQTLVADLVRQVDAYVIPHGWVTKPYAKKMRHGNHQVFEIPALFLRTGRANAIRLSYPPAQ